MSPRTVSLVLLHIPSTLTLLMHTLSNTSSIIFFDTPPSYSEPLHISWVYLSWPREFLLEGFHLKNHPWVWSITLTTPYHLAEWVRFQFPIEICAKISLYPVPPPKKNYATTWPLRTSLEYHITVNRYEPEKDRQMEWWVIQPPPLQNEFFAGTWNTRSAILNKSFNHSVVTSFGTTTTWVESCLCFLASLKSSVSTCFVPGGGVHTNTPGVVYTLQYPFRPR